MAWSDAGERGSCLEPPCKTPPSSVGLTRTVLFGEDEALATDKPETIMTSYGQAALMFRDIALLVLAAGRSRRMGSPKALVEFEGRPLVEHLLAPPLLRDFGDVVVVLGHHHEALLPAIARAGCRYVVNRNPDQGRTGSAQVGLRMLRASIRAVFVQPVDCPIILPRTYAALATALGSSDVVIPCFRGQRGHPPLFSARNVPQILAASPDQPLRDLLQAPGTECRFVEVDDPGVLINIDRPEDLQSLFALRAAHREAESQTQGKPAISNGPSTV